MTAMRVVRKRCAAWLGVVALLVQAWLPLVHHPVTLFASDSGEAAAIASLAGEHALCLAAAQAVPQQAPSTDQHAPDKRPPDKRPPDKDQHLSMCPICRVLHAAGGVPPPPAALYTPQAVAFHPDGVLPRAFVPVARIERAALPRAPPLPV
jgi:hypothetical protein